MSTKIVVPEVNPVSLAGKLVIIQFRLGIKAWHKHPASKQLPPSYDTTKPQKTQKTQGVMFLTSTEKMNVLPCVEAIVDAHEMTSATTEWMETEGCYVAQFVFSPKGSVNKANTSFTANRWRYLLALKRLAENSFWRTRGFINPPEQNGGEMIALNCHFPIHRFRGNGELVTEWGPEGKKLGEEAPPIQPSCSLKVIDGHICVE